MVKVMRRRKTSETLCVKLTQQWMKSIFIYNLIWLNFAQKVNVIVSVMKSTLNCLAIKEFLIILYWYRIFYFCKAVLVFFFFL
jgi:hypothetical protein